MTFGIARPGTNRAASGNTTVASASPNAAAATHTDCLCENQQEHRAIGKAHGLEDRELRGTLPTDCIIMVAVANSSAASTALTIARMRKSRSPIC